MDDFWSSPPVILVIFLAIAYGLYQLGGMLAPKGEDSDNKRLPYTGGERSHPLPEMLMYHAYFQLALFFCFLHVATLVLSTVPRHGPSRRIALIYLVGVGVSVFVMTGEEEA